MIAIGGGIGMLLGLGVGILAHHMIAGAIIGGVAGMIAHRLYIKQSTGQ